MTTGNHTVRDIYCVKCATILGWKYVCIHLASSQVYSCNRCRIEHMNLPRNTRRENIFSSAISSSTCNERHRRAQPYWSTHSSAHSTSVSFRGRSHCQRGPRQLNIRHVSVLASISSSFTTHCDSLPVILIGVPLGRVSCLTL